MTLTKQDEEFAKANADHVVLSELTKAVKLFVEEVYNMEDLFNHILQIIRDNSADAMKYKDQMERLLFKQIELQQKQAMYWSGHKTLLPECKKLEKELIEKCKYLISHGGFTIERFIKEQPKQERLF